MTTKEIREKQKRDLDMVSTPRPTVVLSYRPCAARPWHITAGDDHHYFTFLYEAEEWADVRDFDLVQPI